MAARAGVQGLIAQDPVVPFATGARAQELLEKHGFPVTWRPFNGAHEISPAVLAEVAQFLS